MRATLAFCAALIALPAYAQVTPSGATATTTTTNADGSVTISIAPPDVAIAGTSHNQYDDFNVGPAGVLLDNGLLTPQAPARTIINEVTSTNPSLLAGPIEVLGNRAHVVIANPNGVTANGASFVNTGAAVLTTGRVTNATGNPTLEVRTGQVVIGPRGLAGQFSHLELLAKQIQINGPISLDESGVTTRLVAGDTNITLDNTTIPGDAPTPYTNVADAGGTASGVVLDVTRAGLVRGGRVEVVVTDDGGGVRNAGTIAADQFDFVIASDGFVTFDGGSARAEQGGVIRANAGDINNLGGRIEAASLDLNASGDILNFTTADAQAILFAEDGDLIGTAGGDIINDQARIISNASIDLDAGGATRNIVQVSGDVTGGERVVRSERKGRRSWASLFLVRDRVEVEERFFAEERVEGADALIFAATDVDIAANRIENLGAEITANDGDLTLTATADIDNQAYATGSVTFEKRCNWLFCSEHATSDAELTGGLLNAGRDITATAGTRFNNGGGVLTAVRNITIDAPEITNEARAITLATDAQQGMLGLWAHRTVSARFERGGSYLAGGTIDFRGPGVVDFAGGALETGGGLIGAPAVNTVTPEQLEVTLQPLQSVSLLDALF